MTIWVVVDVESESENKMIKSCIKPQRLGKHGPYNSLCLICVFWVFFRNGFIGLSETGWAMRRLPVPAPGPIGAEM